MKTLKPRVRLPLLVLRMRSRCSGVRGVGLRCWRGERELGVEAGDRGSGGRSGGGKPLCTNTLDAHSKQTLCWHGSRMGCFTMSSHTGQRSSRSMLFMLDWNEKIIFTYFSNKYGTSIFYHERLGAASRFYDNVHHLWFQLPSISYNSTDFVSRLDSHNQLLAAFSIH